LYSDLHLDNVLFRVTKDKVVVYSIDVILETLGYQIVIMDFEMSFMGIENSVENRKFFWDDLLSTFNRVYELKTLACVNLPIITDFLNMAGINFWKVDRALELLSIIDNLEFINHDRTSHTLKYNPNIF